MKRKRRRVLSVVPEAYQREWDPDRAFEARRLLSAYNLCLKKTNNPVFFEKDERSLDQLIFFDSVAFFCEKVGFDPITQETVDIDPICWIYFVFARSGFTHAPRGDAFFRAAAAAGLYEKMRGDDYDGVAAIEIALEDPRARIDRNFVAFRPFRDLAPGAEEAKRQLLIRGKEEICLYSMDVTYGFHPGSKWCAQCKMASVCAPKTRALAAEWDEEQRRKGKR